MTKIHSLAKSLTWISIGILLIVFLSFEVIAMSTRVSLDDLVERSDLVISGIVIGESSYRESILIDISPPLPSVWDGSIGCLREAFEARLAREENPMARMMLRMTADPESVIAMNQDPNTSQEDLMLSYLACQHVIEKRGTDSILDHMIEAGESGRQLGDGFLW